MIQASRHVALAVLLAAVGVSGIAQDNFPTRPRVALSKNEVDRLIHEEKGRIIRDRVNEALASGGAQVRLRTVVAPVYPHELVQDRVVGEVEALFLVDEAGDVAEVRIENATNELFQQAVVFALKQWKFGSAIDDLPLKRFAARQKFQFKPEL